MMKTLAIVVLLMFAGGKSFAQQITGNIKKVSAKDVRAMIDTSTGPMIINFWASWCGPCIREIPYFEAEVAQSTKPVKLLLVSVDYAESYPKKLNSFVAGKGYKSEVVYLNETDPAYFLPLIESKWTGAIPASIFVNHSKKYYRFLDMQLTEPRLALELKDLLQ